MLTSKKWKRISLGLIGSLLIGLGASPTWANVSLKNGNFFIGYTDIKYPGGFEPKIERVYNSKSAFKGIFGHGWGTSYEVYLVPAPDGSVVVHEYGGGAENRFYPPQYKKSQLNEGVDKIVNAAAKAGIIPAGKKEQYVAKLKKDVVFRNEEWRKLLSRGLIKQLQVKPGTQYKSNRFSFQYITKLKEGYQRVFDNGRSEIFSEDGKLAQISDKNKNFIKFAYDRLGRLDKIIDNFRRKMDFKFNSRGLLVEINGENKKKANFRYNKLDELVYSKDVDGNVYEFSYSDDKRHNLVQIKYSDRSTLQIAYYDRKMNENVSRVKERDGTITEYKYSTNKPNAKKLTVATRVLDKDGKRLISKSSYSYNFKVKKTGERWTYQLTTNIDDDITETTYNECCGLPVQIKRGKEVTRFAYDDRGHVIKKDDGRQVTQLKYHKSYGKVTRVVKYPKANKKLQQTSNFKYDNKGNLERAENSDGKIVRLFYDANGRIRSMVDQDKRTIQFKYDENSKPVEIKDPKLGTIKVTYNNSGEIKNVQSSAGRRIAMQVTSAFQNLLAIIRPAGVTLGP